MALNPQSPFRDVVSAWLRHLRARVDRDDHLVATTLAAYRRDIGRSEPLFDLPIGQICPLDVLNWHDEIRVVTKTGKISKAVPDRALKTLHTCLAWARLLHLTPTNAASQLRRTYEAEPGNPLTLPQLARFLRAVTQLESDRATWYARRRYERPLGVGILPTILRLLVITGARVGEIARRKRSEVAEDFSRITIGRGKNGKKRIVILVPLAQQILREHMERTASLGNDWLFPSPKHPLHDRISDSSVWHSFKEVQRRAGIRGITPHDLRHTALTELDRLGVESRALMGFGGHTHQGSLRPYLHLSERPASREAAEQYAALLAPLFALGGAQQ